MSKVHSFLIEDDIVLLKDAEIDFVSLVSHAANQQPFKIIKGQVKGDKQMNKVIYSLLVPKNIGDEKLEELSKEYSLEEKDEESLEDHVIYKQVKDEEVDGETKKLAVVDKESKVYCIVAEKVEESKVEPTEKELDYATMDSLGDAAMAMLDITFGTLRQPESSTAQRRNAVLSAIDNFRKYAEVVLSNSKTEDVIDLKSIEVKGENITELFTIVEPKKEENLEEDKFEAFKETIISLVDEKAKAEAANAVDEFKTGFEAMKDELNTNLNSQFEDVALKSELEAQLKEIKDEIEKLKGLTHKRNSEIDEGSPEDKKTKTIKTKREFVTFA